MTRLLARALTVTAFRLLAIGHLSLGLALWGLVSAPALAAESPKIVGAHLGLGDGYKVGFWAPLRVVVEGGDAPVGVTVLAITPDSDGVGVATTTPSARPFSTQPGVKSEERLYVRVGQQNAPIEVRVYADGRQIDRRVFPVTNGDFEKIKAGKELPLANSAINRLFVQLGADVGAAFESDAEGYGAVGNAATLITNPDDLPPDAIGYDGVDAVVLTTGARALDASAGWLGQLTANDPRLSALVEWVRGGGRLVLSCGAASATMLAEGGPLAELLPGDYAGPSSIADTSAIERFADVSGAPDMGVINQGVGTLNLALVENPRGQVLAHAGRTATETPLVIRAPVGFGEVTFVAFDLDAPAIANWNGRDALVRQLLRLPFNPPDESRRYGDWRVWQQDLVNTLLAKLDDEFVGVRTTPFLAIVGLVVLYLLLIGPGDYFFVKNVLRRVEATWVTFPILVAATSAAAYFGAYWLKGDKLRVNQVEIIDIDTADGATRGRLITHLFSPTAKRYDVSLAPKTLTGESMTPTASGTAWLGKPSMGLGGMQSSSSNSQSGVAPNYQIDATPLVAGPLQGPTVAGMPVQVWSTKTLVSRYSGETGRVVESQLAPDGGGLVEGSVTNDTGIDLADCRLLYGTWAWKLGAMGDGETKSVDPGVSPLRITTLLGKASETNPYARNNRWTTIAAMGDALSVGSLTSSDGEAASRYLHDLDLANHLAAGKAILLAQIDDGPRTELVRAEGPLVELGENEETLPSQRSWVFVRFLLPIEKTGPDEE
ncbi:hypothetical protein [Botrimarina mediterranea]|uniref:Glutamine amidotransferase domain-containing protein n=1 Tax=Botrimarina mediterranea TaxID=2528022 RepID=A0A518KD24_9BACT|nr:hypothetical protein [Botrimarina mediterranea]QDV75696.1 hypothetical protein Spa11_39160 [Botrimarina mediterranea]